MKKFIIFIVILIIIIVVGVLLLRQCTTPPPILTPTATAMKPTEIPTKTATLKPTETIVPPTATPTPTSTPEPTETPTIVPPQKTVYVISVYDYGGKVWFRRGPSRSFLPREIDAVLYDGDEVEILGCFNPAGTFVDWIKVSSNRIVGFVFGQFIKTYPCD